MLKSKIYKFRFRTGEVVIDHKKCMKCKTYTCIKGDSLFGRSVLRIQGGKPVLTTSFEEAQRTCNECLTCEIYCQSHGNKGLKINLDTFGLEEYNKVKKFGKEV